ncbi:MAG: CoA-transferase [Dehalococcoidia bacterium]
MSVIQVLAEGTLDFHPVDPDGFREYVRDHKRRALEPRLMGIREAVERFVQDGDYLAYDCNFFMRGPSALLREVIRQRKKDLWVCGKFTYVDSALLTAGGCAAKIDVGFQMAGPWLRRALDDGLKIYEYSNVVMTTRLQAGSMGVPFLPIRSFGGTDGFKYSGAKLIEDPYTGQPLVIVPALNPDVSLIHVQQADQYGNCRVFGTGISHVECALASKRVIISAEEIVDTEEIRRDPGRTTIPYYVVDAVVHAPFGCYPGEVQGYYASDSEGVLEVFASIGRDQLDAYLQKYVYDHEDEQQMLDRVVGQEKLNALKARATIKDGYHP